MNKEKIEEREEYLAKYGVDSLDTGYSCYEEKKNLSVEEQELEWLKYIELSEMNVVAELHDFYQFALTTTILSTTFIFSNSEVLDSVVKVLVFLYFSTMLYNYFETITTYSKYEKYLKSGFGIKTFQKRQVYTELPMIEVISDTSDLSIYTMDELLENEPNIMEAKLAPKVLTKKKVKTNE